MGDPHTVRDMFFYSMQLFVLEFNFTSGTVPLELEIARLLAPSIAVFTTVKAIAILFSEQLQLFRIKFIKDHVVICGLGRKGLLFAKTFYEKGYSVIAIEQDSGNDFINQCRQYSVVLIGNAADKGLLQKARVQTAKYIISVCGDDGINAEVSLHSRELVMDQKRKVLKCLVHIVDPQLCYLLKEQEIESQDMNLFRLEFFNVYESAARVLLGKYPPFTLNDSAQYKCPHILIVGLGRMGRSLLVQAARNWKDIHKKTEELLRITIIDKFADTKLASLSLQFPKLRTVSNIMPLQIDTASLKYEKANFLFNTEGKCDVTHIYVCFDEDAHSLSSALMLHHRLRDQGVPIIVRMNYDAGLARLLQGEGSPGFSNLHAFGLLDQTCKPDLLLGGTFEVLARAIHEQYVHDQAKAGKTPEQNPSMVPWEHLPEHLKESNRQQANHIGIKLSAVGCSVAPLNDWEAELFQFAPEEVEKLSEMEHERWNKERESEGWQLGDKKDINSKITPYLVPYAKLPDEIKEYDRNMIRGIPSFLAKAGFQVYRGK